MKGRAAIVEALYTTCRLEVCSNFTTCRLEVEVTNKEGLLAIVEALLHVD